jgi:hypothetical protein
MAASARDGRLSKEAQFAEDLAIRYADARRTPPLEGYDQNRVDCMAKVFRVVGDRQGLTAWEVWESLQHRPSGFDLAQILSFAVLYTLAAYLLGRAVLRRYWGREELWGWAAMTAFLPRAASGAGLPVGEAWCLTMENFRIGNGHLSYRAARLRASGA